MVEFPLTGHDLYKYLPHRYPFLLVDRVISYDAEQHLLRGYKNISFNEEVFNGHLPGAPIFPGVLITEAMLQLMLVAAYIDEEVGKGNSKGQPRLASLDKFKFRRPVVPGDRLDMEAQYVRHRSNFATYKVAAFVDGEPASSGMATCLYSNQ